MERKNTRWSASSILLAISGMLVIGCYFLFLRPALLPEDIRYMNLAPAELQSVGPRLAAWLSHVFRVMGGYVTATGVLTHTLAVTEFRQRHSWAVAGASLAGVASIGWMINWDFKWVLLGMALVSAASIAALALEAGRRPAI